jgi:hypothetical protein
VENVPGDRIVLERFKEYWGPQANVDKLVFRRLDDPAARVAALRTGEVDFILAPPPDEVEALHDMRIAAKRLRYILELFAPRLGPDSGRAAKEAKKLQDLIGEIHDCDVNVPVVERHIEELRLEDAAAVRDRVAPQARDLNPKKVTAAPHRAHYQGLEALVTYLRARRQVLYARFLREWARLEQEGFRRNLEAEMTSLADEQLRFEATAKLLEKTYQQIRVSMRDR